MHAKHHTHLGLLSHHKMPHLMMMLTLLFTSLTLFLFQSDSSFVFEWEITTINSASISFPILMEAESFMFMSTVSFISFNVLIFSKFYMMSEINLQRFTQLVMSFIASMMALILSPNTMTMLLGWDGLGITSFLLVIYYNNNRALKSGFITLISNRIGDCFILMAIAMMMTQGHWNVFNMWTDENPSSSTLSTLILFAAMTKSAQFPFMAWLTCAMAAPTPVSALVHSSTLVTAGVFILIRFYPMLSQFNHFNILLMTAGSMTMFLGAFWAVTKKDVKEVVALSTMSQLGLMMTTLSLGLVELCFFHMLTHAMFKATMFMAVGMGIVFKGHRQNFANIKTKKHSRTMGIALIISILSMNAMFFTAGYFSKDAILEMVWYSPNILTTWLLFMPSTALTMTYSTRIWRSTFTTKTQFRMFYHTNNKNLFKTHMMSNSLTMMEIPLLFMTMASIMSGGGMYWLVATPSEFAIVPTQTKVIAPMLTLIGWFMAAGFCPSNKAKLFNSTLHKLKMKYLIKPYKALNKHIEVNNSNKIKINHHTTMKMKMHKNLEKIIEKKTLVYKTSQTMNSESKATQTTQFSCVNFYVKSNYKMAMPFLKMSLMIEKSLDMGLFYLIGPKTATKITNEGIKMNTKIEKIHINKMLLIMILVSLLVMLVYFPNELIAYEKQSLLDIIEYESEWPNSPEARFLTIKE